LPNPQNVQSNPQVSDGLDLKFGCKTDSVSHQTVVFESLSSKDDSAKEEVLNQRPHSDLQESHQELFGEQKEAEDEYGVESDGIIDDIIPENRAFRQTSKMEYKKGSVDEVDRNNLILARIFCHRKMVV